MFIIVELETSISIFRPMMDRYRLLSKKLEKGIRNIY